MRKLGLMLSGIFILGAFMALSAVSAFARSPEWENRCGPDPYKQEFKVYDFFFRTDNRYQLEPSAYHGGGKICGPWAARYDGPDPIDLDSIGRDTFATGWGERYGMLTGGAEIWVPYGVRVEPTVGPYNPTAPNRIADGNYMGSASVRTLTWVLGYRFDASILPATLPLKVDKSDGPSTGLGKRQRDPYSTNPEDRKGCLRDSDVAEYFGDPDAKVISCVKGDILGLASSWISTVRYTNSGDPDVPYLYMVSIGELFGIGNRYATLTEITDYFQCERVGPPGGAQQCGAPGRPNVHFNGYADDAQCSLGYGEYWAGVYFRNAENPWTSACVPWQVRP